MSAAEVTAWPELFGLPRPAPHPWREEDLATALADLQDFDAKQDRLGEMYLAGAPGHVLLAESERLGVPIPKRLELPDGRVVEVTQPSESPIDPLDSQEPERTEPTVPSNGSVRLTPISSIQARRVTWLEEDLIPRGMVTGLVAAGGTVKGLYGVLLGVRAALRGERTLFLCSEDALEYIVKPRFLAQGCDTDLAMALWVEAPDGSRRNLRFPSELPSLREAILGTDPSLVVIDPMASHLDSGLDMAKNNVMREILQPLISVAEETGAAIMPVYHLGKDLGRGALGSVAFEDACRCVLTAARDDEEEDVRHVEVTKSNVGPTGYGRKLRIVETLLEIDGETVGVAKVTDEGRSAKSVPALLQRRKRPGPDPTQRESARERLVAILSERPGGSVNAGETKKLIAAELDVSESTVWRAFTALKKEDLAGATPIKDELGSILEWRWYAKPALLVGASET